MQTISEALDVDDPGKRALEPSFEAFFATQARKLVGMAYLLTGDLGEAQDLAQEALIRVWERWDRVSTYEKPEAFARRVLHNLVIGRWRRRRSAPPDGPLRHTPAPDIDHHLYTAADYDATDEAFNPPAPWQALKDYQSTPASDDNPAYPVLLLDPEGYAPRLVLGPAAATGDIVHSASVGQLVTGETAVNVALTPAGTRAFDALASRYYHTPVAIDLSGTLVSEPLILATHYPNGILIEGGGSTGLTAQQAKDIAAEIGHGPLPLTLRLVSTNTLTSAA